MLPPSPVSNLQISVLQTTHTQHAHTRTFLIGTRALCETRSSATRGNVKKSFSHVNSCSGNIWWAWPRGTDISQLHSAVINTADRPSGCPSLVGELYSAYFDFTFSTSTYSAVRTEAHGCPTLTRYTRTLSHHARTQAYTCMPTCTWVPGIEQRTRSSTSPGRPCSPSF